MQKTEVSGAGGAEDLGTASLGIEGLPLTKIASIGKAVAARHDQNVAKVLQLLAERWPRAFVAYQANLHHLFQLLAAWNFRYCTGRPWLKTWPKRDGLFLTPDSFAVGTGYEIRATTEVQVVAKRGHPQRLNATKLRGHIIAPRREHSRKPDCVRDEIAQLFDGPCCELFARSRHPGFESWGDQVNHFNEVNEQLTGCTREGFNNDGQTELKERRAHSNPNTGEESTDAST